MARITLHRGGHAACQVCDAVWKGPDAVAAGTAHVRETGHPVIGMYETEAVYSPATETPPR